MLNGVTLYLIQCCDHVSSYFIKVGNNVVIVINQSTDQYSGLKTFMGQTLLNTNCFNFIFELVDSKKHEWF